MSNKPFFVDSNIWLYAFMSTEPENAVISEKLISNTMTVMSSQVVNEVCVNLIKSAI